MAEQQTFYEKIQNKITEIDYNKYYRYIELTGNAIRLAYFDVQKHHKVQMNLGNIFIIISDERY